MEIQVVQKLYIEDEMGNDGMEVAFRKRYEEYLGFWQMEIVVELERKPKVGHGGN